MSKTESKKRKNGKIVLDDDLQKEILRFFIKTSIPRIAKEKREKQEQENKTLSKMKGQG